MSDGGTESNNHVTLDNVSFIYALDEKEFSTHNQDDVKMDSACSLTIRDCHKRVFKNGIIDISEQMGIRIVNASDVGIDDFNQFSSTLSVDGHIGRRFNVRRTRDTLDCGSGALSILQSVTGPTDRTEWQESSATYFYQAQYLFDVKRLIGTTSASGEASASLTFGGNGMVLHVDSGARPNIVTVRIYRGTATGVYSHYVDLPNISLVLAYDSGDRINGYDWITRDLGGADPDGVNSLIDMVEVGGNQDHFIGRNTIIPSSGGNFIPGDRVIKSNPVVGMPKSWVNTVASAGDNDAGTWVSEGNL